MRRMPDSRPLRIPREESLTPRCSILRATRRAAFSSTAGRSSARRAAYGLEQIAAGIVALHPEYHAVLDDPERHLDRDFRPKTATSIRSCICRCISPSPSSSASTSRRACARISSACSAARGDEHAALHALTECLGEMIWHAQRHARRPMLRSTSRASSNSASAMCSDGTWCEPTIASAATRD